MRLWCCCFKPTLYISVCICVSCPQGWVLHAEDTDMDPVAWQLSFGVAVILTLFKDAQMLMGLTQWLSPWLMFAVPTVVGHCYGAFLYFFMVYRSDWPCFLGQTNYNAARKHRMCYEGRLLAAFTSCSLFLTVGARRGRERGDRLRRAGPRLR